MKVFATALLLSASLAVSAGTAIESVPHGSGAPGNVGVENATEVTNGIMHAPQYMPGYPTAATIWPRVIDLPCTRADGTVTCSGYEWSPALGRGEYLFFNQKVQEPLPTPEVVAPVKVPEVLATPLPQKYKAKPKKPLIKRKICK